MTVLAPPTSFILFVISGFGLSQTASKNESFVLKSLHPNMASTKSVPV